MFAQVSFGKSSKQGKGVWNFDHLCFLPLSLPFFMCLQYVILSPPLPPAVRCDTVCDNKNTSFCHCRRANRLIGPPCYPIQTVRPKESMAHFHNIIDRVPRRDAAWKYTHTPCVICMSITSENRGSRHEAMSQFEALLHSQHPRPRTTPATSESRRKTGEQSILGDRK